MSTAEAITSKLREAFEPSLLEVVDQSAAHAGHAGARPGGETHFQVVIASPAFVGMSRVERHRMVHRVLAAELAGPVHALALQTLTPNETR